MILPSNKLCPACGSASLTALSLPNAQTSMLSDGQVISSPLRKMSCCNCGYGFHKNVVTAESLRALFDETYSLGQRDPAAELGRAQSYASVITNFLHSHDISNPRQFIELGCGMGSLLAMLAQRWNSERAQGVEPSAQLVHAAREKVAPGIEVEQGFAEDIQQKKTELFDLCVSVNVIEHTFAPETFLQTCRDVIKTGGHVLVICPDGEVPNLELLFYDHISSFTKNALATFATRAGLRVLATQPLDGVLFGFQILLMERGEGRMAPHPQAPALAEARRAFLQRWQAGAGQLEMSLGGRPYAVFGTGEFADLLAAYCPQIIARAQAFVLDNPTADSYRGVPLMTSDEFTDSADLALVAAVNLRSWPAVQARFAAAGKDVYHPHIPTTE